MLAYDSAIEPYRAEDKPKLHQFFDEVWTPPPLIKSPDWFRWKIENDPNGGLSRPTLLVAHFDERIVGMLVLVPTPLWVGGQVYHVAWGRDLYVDPHYRRHRIGLHIIEAWGSNYPVALGSGQSAVMRNLQVNHGWTEIGKVNQYEKLFLDMGLLRKSLDEGIKKFGKRAAAMAYSACLPDKGGKIAGKVVHRRDFAPSTSDLWEDCLKEYPCIFSRDLKTLRWRFIEHPYYQYTISEFIENGGRHRGYLVTRREGNICWFIDILTRKADHQARLKLIGEAEAYHRRAGVTRFVSRSVCAVFEASLKAMGYVKTSFEQFFSAKFSDDLPLPAADEWYVTAMDSDLDR